MSESIKLAETFWHLTAPQVSANPPKRFVGLYVGHGFAITRKSDHPARDWSWYPRLKDGRMKFGKSTAAFQPLDDQISIFYTLFNQLQQSS